MRFYKKNPNVEGTVFVCGKPIDDKAVVFGEEFAPFADPRTFPGIEPRLVECQVDEIKGDKLDSLKDFEKSKEPERPRHAGPTTTANFHMEGDGARVDMNDAMRTAVAPTPAPAPTSVSSSIQGGSSEKKAAESSDPKSLQEEKAVKPKLISELFSPISMAEHCPGIGESTAAKIIDKFSTMDELANAGNVELRALGVRSQHFNKVRAWAKTKIQ